MIPTPAEMEHFWLFLKVGLIVLFAVYLPFVVINRKWFKKQNSP